MSVRLNTEQSFILKNILIDSYLKVINKKLNNKKHSFIEYLVFCLYVFMILKELTLLRVDHYKTRLYWLDVTLFIGGIRQYNSYVIIVGSVFGLTAFKYLHFDPKPRLMQLIEVLQVFRGRADPNSVCMIRVNWGNIDKLVKFSRRFNFISLTIYSTMGKLELIVSNLK